MRTSLIRATILGAATVLGWSGVAQADLIIVPNGNGGGIQAQSETQLAGGPGFPLTLFGYTSGAILQADVTSWYDFTFEGAGDALSTNVFTSLGNTFTAVGPGGTGAGSTPVGTTFSEFLTAGTAIDFTLTSMGVTGAIVCSLISGTSSTQDGCDYLLALGNSLSSPGLFNVSQTTAWIGFADGASPTDADFQDLVVKVTERAPERVPEPDTLAVFGAGLLGLVGFGTLRRRSNA